MRKKIKECKKAKYSESDALAKIDAHLIGHLNNNKLNRRPQIHAYYCSNCEGWHTTTIPSMHLPSAKI